MGIFISTLIPKRGMLYAILRMEVVGRQAAIGVLKKRPLRRGIAAPPSSTPRRLIRRLKMPAENWLAFDSDAYEDDTFETLEEAKAWLTENNEEGIGEGAMSGRSFIAKITHRTKFTETDQKENYHEHTDACPEDCGEETWPYDPDFENVGKLDFVEVKDAENKCATCGGDGIERCTNPDHGFIYALVFTDMGRIGCPLCGHDEKHRIPNSKCPDCGGTGKTPLAGSVEAGPEIGDVCMWEKGESRCFGDFKPNIHVAPKLVIMRRADVERKIKEAGK